MTFTTTKLDKFMVEALTEVSWLKPYWQTRKVTPTADDRRIVLTSEHMRELLWVGRYPGPYIDYLPSGNTYPNEAFRHNFRGPNGDVDGYTIEMNINFKPSASDTVYLYLAKRNILLSSPSTGDLAGKIDTAAVVGATSIIVKELGTGAVDQNTRLTIAGDTTEYIVIATATITSNIATLSISPALVVAADADDVVTLIQDSTLDWELERIFMDLAAGKAAISKALLSGDDITLSKAFEYYNTAGVQRVSMAISAMNKIRCLNPKISQRYAPSNVITNLSFAR